LLTFIFMNILVIGTGAREHALAWKLAQRPDVKIYNFGPTTNPGIAQLAQAVGRGAVTDVVAVVEWAQQYPIDFAWIGPEDPLAAGIVDALEGFGIACIGPTQRLAQLESSKSFTRELVDKYEINASPAYQIFTSLEGIEDFCIALHDNFVVKPDGLTGGKGVKVMGEQLDSRQEALQYCAEILSTGHASVIIEEKLVGQEFSLMSFSDGKTLVHMPVVQDHKRALVNDEGLNTGGMGSYSDSNHSLPFLTDQDIITAQQINEQVLQAVQMEYHEEYKGVLYGGFMAVRNGVRLIEYNVRFGDPEVMNLMSVLKTDLALIGEAIVNRTLDRLAVEFTKQASVCKYIVPEGYPANPVKNAVLDVSAVDTSKVNIFYGSVDQTEQGLVAQGSRTAAIVGVGATIAEAEQMVEQEIQKIKGPFFHRSDIGTKQLIEKRIAMQQQVWQHQ
jgi:phosphoribosylamine--glycine ligase